MHIAIDARSIFTSGGGDRTYLRELVTHMARLSPDDRWTLYADSFDADRETLRAENVTIAPPSPPRIPALWNVTQLLPALRRDKIDLLHATYMLPPVGVAPCPMIVTIHDVTFRLFPEWFPPRANKVQNLLIPIAARRASKILTISRHSAADISQNLGVSPSRIVVTPLGVDAKFQPSSVKETGEKYLIGVGILRRRKNAQIVLKAIAQLQKTGEWPENAKLILTGNWNGDAEAKAVFDAEPSLKNAVTTLGFVSDDDLTKLYAGATASVYPSLYEGFGLPVLEAMACGCPVISSNTSSLPEVVGNAGILLGPNDLDGWTNAIKQILTDENARDNWANLGQKHAAEFTWERTARETLAVYKSAVKR